MSIIEQPRVIFLTGAMAAGKSTVAEALAGTFARSIHLRGDAFRRMVVAGRVEMGAAPSAEALAQLMLRYRATAQVARVYWRGGFDVVCQDVVLGPVLADAVALFADMPLHVVVLCPRREVIAAREARRAKTGYGSVSIDDLQAALDATPRVGFWLDNSALSVAATARAVLDNLDQARVQ